MTPSVIKAIRLKLGLTQAEAGLLFGGGPRAFTKYEAGEIAPAASLQRLLYVCDKFPAVLGALGIAIATGKLAAEPDEESDAAATDPQGSAG